MHYRNACVFFICDIVFVERIWFSESFWLLFFIFGYVLFRLVVLLRSLRFWLGRSTSPPGGNQVDGLPPALLLICIAGTAEPQFGHPAVQGRFLSTFCKF